MKRALILLLGVVIGLLVLTPSVSAVDGERIRSFESNVVILQNGKAEIQETITYDFGSNEKHGIYRDIPIDYKDNIKLGETILPDEFY